MRNTRKWLFLLALTLVCLLPALSLADALAGVLAEGENEKDYAAYLSANPHEATKSAIPIYQSDGQEIREGTSFTFRFTISEDVFAYPAFIYAMTGGNILDNVYTLKVDGAFPYDECTSLTLDSLWTMDGVFSVDRYGNEVVSMPVKSYATNVCRMIGTAGLYSRGMGLYLAAGDHEITIFCKEGPFALYGVSLVGEIVTNPNDGKTPLTAGASITIQAETVPVRNNPNIRPAADYDMALTPYSGNKKVINFLEDLSYKYAGDALTYTFSVEEEGYYGLALHMRQSELANFPVYRTFLLDGEIPGATFEAAHFDYSLSFDSQIVRNEDGTVSTLYLTEGEHTLTVLTTLDPLRAALHALNRVSDEIAALALDISKITGGNTDFFRDFALADFGFHVADDLARWDSRLLEVRDSLYLLCDAETRVGALSNLDMTISLLNQLAEKPDDLPKKLTLLSRGTSSARSFLVAAVELLSTSPMGLDSIHFFTDESQLPRGGNILEQAASAAERFAASFDAQSYGANKSDSDRLQVWVNRPRQYLEIMQRMADTGFTAQTGIAVDFSIMPDESKLILSNASGTAPDVALGVTTTRVYDLAVRGALKDLREYESFKTVAGWFPTGLLIPGVCDAGVYALPETFNFYVLYYRKDVLDSLGLAVPNCYEEVLAMLPTLHRYGLNFNNFVSNAIGYKSFSITTPFIFQCGGKLYEDGNIKTLLDQENAIKGLQLLTDSFIIYDMDYEINSFYQSFRDGTLPIGTSNYAMYNLLMNAAPELSDKWGIALYPGVTDANGTVQRWTSGAEQSDFIFSSTDKSQDAWAFLSWWMSEETQTEFAFTLQSTLGNEYMWNSANTAAFLNSPWPMEHKKVIAEQMTWICEAPRVPGSYMVERELSNTINAVALEGKNLRAALDEAIKRIDREVERKLEEFGRLLDGELIVPFTVPNIDMVRRWLE